MNIQPSSRLQSDYGTISRMAHETGEPVYITSEGYGDLVLISNEAFEQREQALRDRAGVLEAEARRLSHDPAFTTEEVREMLRNRRIDDVA